MKNLIKISLLVLSFITFNKISNAQYLTCSEAGLSPNVLCSLGELDDFSSTMPAFNINDEPAPFCNGTGNPQNMSWFAFIAGSASAELELVTSNCISGNSIQYGIYTDCNYNDEIICQGNPVNASGTITLNLNGMTPGDDYFFFIDGDLGTYCDYSINVVSGGDPVPVPDPTGISCISANCPTDNAVCLSNDTYTFKVEGLDLSIDYNWSITPLPPGFPANPQTINGSNTIDLSFPEANVYNICMEATNGCTTTTPFCFDFTVFEADAGILSASPNPLCPTETSTITVSDYTMSAAASEKLIVVGPDGVIMQIVDPPSVDVTYDQCGTLKVYSYNYLTGNNPGVPTVGSAYTSPDCSSYCCDTKSIDIVFEDNENPTFVNPPQNVTINCEDGIPTMDELTWNDNCSGTGTVMGTEVQNYNTCSGGTITRTWTYTDGCMNTVDYVQTISLNPAPPPVYINPPADEVLDCNQVPSTIPTLTVSNNQSGTCLISGTVNGTETSTFDVCTGGVITRTWDYTDICGNTINFVQTITINPPPTADFINPPSDMTINCDQIPTTFPDLSLTNGESGNCLITGSIAPTVMGNPGTCGGDIDVVWIFTDQCNRVTSHVQTLTVLAAAPPTYINPPTDLSLVCGDPIPSATNLNYDNGESGSCNLAGFSIPLIVDNTDVCGGTITRTWEFTDNCNQTISHVQTIDITPPLEASYSNPPSDITIDCDQTPTAPMDLNYDNGASGSCKIMGTTTPVVVDNSDICGGTIINTWEFTDVCSRLISHVQTITIEPAPVSVFENPPADVTINCDDIPTSPQNLNYTNSTLGNCSISGTITPTVQDNSTSCGGNIIYTWEFTDACSRTITHTQTITITEAPIASFVSLPMDETLSCSATFNPASPLGYSNNDNCAIMGTVDPVVVDNTTICGGTIVNTWDFTDDCGRNINHVQTITKEAASQAVFVNPPANGTVNCGDSATTPGDLSYTNSETNNCEISGSVAPVQSGSYTACGGSIIFTWEFIDDCSRVIQHVQTIVVEPSSQAAFIDPPSDMTVSCADFNPTAANLSYTNGASDICEIAGEVVGTLQSTPNPCGTTVQFRWEFTDDCGRTITHTQNVTIEEAPQATFINPPADITSECNNVPSSIPSLSYTNNANGVCAIAGSVNGIQSGSYDECGGNITYSWTFTDACNRVISHSQVINVNPASNPVFTNPPADLSLDCEDSFPVDPSLTYSNSESGNCSISGTVIATSTTSGSTTSYTWEYTNPCNGNTISHTQNITGVSTPVISISPTEAAICYGTDYDLSTISVTNQSGNNITITYLDENGNLISNPIVSPTQVTMYTIVATNNAGCKDEAIFTINIDNPPTPGIDGTGKICDDNQTHDLFDYLNGAYESNGTWFDTDNSGANIDNPSMTDFSAVSAGFYNFTYTVFSTNTCPDASAIVTIEFVEELDIEILMVECETNGITYHVNVSTDGNIIITTAGDVNTIDADNVIIENIPTGQDIVVSAYDSDGLCNTNINVNAPDCDCPDVPVPIGDDSIICEGEDNPELTVIVNTGFKANWYGSASGSDLLLANSPSYTPSVSAAGNYTFYVESENIDGCTSLIRTPIKLTINAVPTLNLINVPFCADENGEIQVVLSDLNALVNTNANFIFTYYTSLADAENSMNPLSNNYTASSTTTIYVSVENTSSCVSIAEVVIALAAIASYDLTQNNESCIGEKDGSIQFSNITPPNTKFSLDDVSYELVSDFDHLEPGNYTVFSLTENNCKTSQSISIQEGLTLSYTDLVITCNDNGTNTDSSDDFYKISFNVGNNQGLTDNVNVSIPSKDYGNLSFGDVNIEIPAGPEQIITILHPVSGCSIMINTGDLSPCSSSCSITIDDLEQECMGNGTPTDPSDDIYMLTISASAINGAANNTFNVLVDGNIINNFTYGTGGSISIPAQGQTVNLSIVDNADSQCFSNQVLGPLNPCSDVCILTIDNTNFICDNQGTIGLPGDDTYTFSFNILATNSKGSSFYLFIDGTNVGTYDYNTISNYVLPADDNIHNIAFVDVMDADCELTMDSPMLESCSGTCTVSAMIITTNCYNEGTADNDMDDTFTADVKIDLVGGSGNWVVSSTGQTGTSGQTVVLGPYLIADGILTIEISDNGISSCTTTIELVPPPSCSSCEGWADAGADVILDCDITEAILSGTASSAGVPSWSGPGGFFMEEESVTVSVAGTYIYAVNLGDDCIKRDTMIVGVSNDIPTAIAGMDQAITCIQDSVLLVGTVIGGSGNFTYQWLDEDMIEISTSIEIKIGKEGNYFFVVYDIDTDCTSPASALKVLDHTQNPTAVIHADPGNILDCVVEIIYLTSDNEPDVEYTWYVNNVIVNENQIVIEEAADIRLIAFNNISGCEDESSLNIPKLEAYPIIFVSPIESLSCNTSTITIDASSSQSGNNISYVWTDEEGTILASDVDMINVSSAGTYYLELMDDNNGCTNRDTIVVSGSSETFYIDLDASIISAPGETISLDASINIDIDEINSIQWTPEEDLSCSSCLSTDLIVGSLDQTYTISVIDNNGCSAQANISVISNEEVIITIPNILSPSGNVDNQYFTVYTTDEKAIITRFSVFDRWGGRIFMVKDQPVNQANVGWDSKYKGTQVNPGVYVYDIELSLSNGEKIRKVGDITVVR